MCAIAGIVNFDRGGVNVDDINVMLNKMEHRGPDDRGCFVQGNVGLGHNRLSIVDLSAAGHQPLVSVNEDYIIVFNGEIYNHLELRHELEAQFEFASSCDTEVLLNSYIAWGEGCLERLNGMFAFAIYDVSRKRLFAARDRFGIKPFYYYRGQNRFLFGSEIPAILTQLKQGVVANEQAIFDFLAFNVPDQDESTFFEGVVKLPAGCYLTMSLEPHKNQNENNIQAQVKVTRWYDIRQKLISGDIKPFKDAQQFRQLFATSAKLQLRADVPVGVCLSGGIDSSAVAAILVNDHHKHDLNTFSAVYGKGVSGDESDYIDSMAEQLQSMHYVTPDAQSLLADYQDFVRTQAEPVSSTALYAQYKVMELASQSVKVTLDGQGADEQLAGYLYFFGFYYKSLLKQGRWLKLIKEVKANWRKHRSLFALKSFVYVMLPAKMQTRLRVGSKGAIAQTFTAKYSQTSRSAERFFCAKGLTDALIKHFEYKLDHLLKWQDRNSMRFSVESRVPFLDHHLVERTLASDISQLISQGTTKQILRQAVQDVVPDKIVNRQDKMGFKTPDDDWFREPQMQQIFIELIDSDKARARNILDIDQVLSRYQLHLEGEINIASELWKWLNLELWFRQFID